MAEFPPPPDINAAQLWLPSQISTDEDRPHPFSCKGDLLSQSQIASLPFPESNHNVSRAPPILPPKGSIPAAGYSWMNPPSTTRSVTGSSGALSGYGPYGGTCLVGVGPYGYGRQYPQVNVNTNNGFVESKDKVMQWQQNRLLPCQPTSIFGLVRRGTGVFHPPCPPVTNNNRPSKNRGMRNKQRAEITTQTQRSRNSFKRNDGLVKQKECNQHPPSSEMGLPNEWTY